MVTCCFLQAMEEHRVCQAKIVDALEAEKKKISKELQEMQNKRALRENHTLQNGESFQFTAVHLFGAWTHNDS